MPIYEFYCADCHRVYNFLSRTVSTSRKPACPRCGRKELERKPSLFAVSRGGADAEQEDALPSGFDEEKLANAMAGLEHEAAGGEDDPKAAARMMRRLWDKAGLKLGPGMDEAFRRMEAGEDPESIEAEMGDVLESEDPFARAPSPGGKKSLRRLLPPTVDPELHEL